MSIQIIIGVAIFIAGVLVGYFDPMLLKRPAAKDGTQNKPSKLTEITLTSGTKFKGEVVRKYFDWLPFESNGLCLETTFTETEEYSEPKSKEKKTREVTRTGQVFIKKEFISSMRKVTNG